MSAAIFCDALPLDGTLRTRHGGLRQSLIRFATNGSVKIRDFALPVMVLPSSSPVHLIFILIGEMIWAANEIEVPAIRPSVISFPAHDPVSAWSSAGRPRGSAGQFGRRRRW